MTLTKQVYLAGDMLNKGAQMQRTSEKEDIKSIGLNMYVPQDNEEINDKKNAVQEGLAERIVRHDTDAIVNSDVIVIEPLPQGLGTHVELGQVHGMKTMAQMILNLANDNCDECSSAELLNKIIEMSEGVVNKKVFPHYEDIRRVKGLIESEDRRSLGINQYVYGICLDLTDGKGFYEWDEVLAELTKIKNDPTL
ncbi:hypothetical protein CN984_12065 [Bacillus cereus]|uniref:Uncharacterized protein n=1 Tax=Bacillus cereus TaxID=1396 RepID=A0A2A7FND3_BACCE|nr:hypothetical protein CON44_18030 [Bacillus cereus]PGO29175.1 hypothetical protein CN984_12065 [Bacillus cereus]